VAGQPLATLRNLPLQSGVAEAQSAFVVASDRATSAALHYENYGVAEQEKESSAARSRQMRLKAANLNIVSPISGVVLTPHLQDRAGSYLTEGTDLLEIGDLNTLRARIYVSEYEMYKVREGAPARLRVEGMAHTWNTRATAISPVSQETDPTLADTTKFKGLHPPQFYLVELLVSGADGSLKPGMTGVARIYGERISLAGLGLQSLRNALGRKVW